jgi:hypothetical protein
LSENGVLPIVYVIANVSEMAKQLESDRSADIVTQFIRGFNSHCGPIKFIDVGLDPIIKQKMLFGMNTLSSHLTQLEQIGCFLNLASCRYLILGVQPHKFMEFVKSALLKQSKTRHVIFLGRPGTQEAGDQFPNEFGHRIRNISVRRVFSAPFSAPSPPPILAPNDSRGRESRSYVEIVQNNVSAFVPEGNGDMARAPPMDLRKVSGSSTGSSQPDEITNLEGGLSDLSLTTRRRQSRMENRRREKARNSENKRDNGLLAVIPCPTEEPDKSTTLRDSD